MSRSPASFELERFSVTPVSEDTVLLELQGVLVDLPRGAAPPRLLVEGARRSRHEREALEVELEADQLRASFIVPATDAQRAGFALAVGGLLLELPAPDPSPDADRAVALARELNGARRQLTRLRTRLEEQAGAARDHARELAAARDDAAAEAQERVQAAEERAAATEQAAGEREAAAQARLAEVERAAGARESELETACARLEDELADVRASAEERDAAAAEERRRLESELTVAQSDAAAGRAAADAAAARVEEAEQEGRTVRSDLELARRALDARDAELARSPDRRARAVSRPRTVAALAEDTAESAEVAATDEADLDGATEALRVDDEATTLAVETDGQPTAAFAVPDAAAIEDEEDGDPVPDDGEADVTGTHAAAPTQRVEPEPPEDTGPIPLRRGSERRYAPRDEHDAQSAGDAVRVPGRDRPRASALPTAPEADAGPPALPFGLTPRTLVIAVFALAAFLVLVAVLGYVF